MERPKRRRPSIVTPSMSSKSTLEPTTSNMRGSRLTRTPTALATRISSSVCAVSVDGRGEDHAVDVVLEHERQQPELALEGVRRTGRAERQRGHHLGAGAAGVDLAADVRGQLGVADHEAALGRIGAADERARARKRRATSAMPSISHISTSTAGSSALPPIAADDDRRHRGEQEQHRRLVERGAAQDQVVAVVEVAGLEREARSRAARAGDGRELRGPPAARRTAARSRRRARRRRSGRAGSGARGRARPAAAGPRGSRSARWTSGGAAGPAQAALARRGARRRRAARAAVGGCGDRRFAAPVRDRRYGRGVERHGEGAPRNPHRGDFG